MERLQYSTARTNNDDNWPIIGPSSLVEALLELDEAERQIEAGEGLPWESVLEEIKGGRRLEVWAAQSLNLP